MFSPTVATENVIIIRYGFAKNKKQKKRNGDILCSTSFVDDQVYSLIVIDNKLKFRKQPFLLQFPAHSLLYSISKAKPFVNFSK